MCRRNGSLQTKVWTSMFWSKKGCVMRDKKYEWAKTIPFILSVRRGFFFVSRLLARPHARGWRPKKKSSRAQCLSRLHQNSKKNDPKKKTLSTERNGGMVAHGSGKVGADFLFGLARARFPLFSACTSAYTSLHSLCNS